MNTPDLDRLITVEQLTGVRYVTPLREGGSLPAIVETEDDRAFVVKFLGAGQGRKALVAECLGAGLAQALGLPVPDAAVVSLDDGFGIGEPDPEIQDLLRASVGLNFGLAYLPGALAFDPAADRDLSPDMAADIVWFDEEPPLDIYSEGLTRTNTTGGITIVTFTPLKGMSEVVLQFLSQEQLEELLKATKRAMQ